MEVIPLQRPPRRLERRLSGRTGPCSRISDRRADAIKQVLSTTFAVPADVLFAVGVGEEQPIDAAHPDASINRRVQIFNIGQVE
jgi:hypothetical protein